MVSQRTERLCFLVVSFILFGFCDLVVGLPQRRLALCGAVGKFEFDFLGRIIYPRRYFQALIIFKWREKEMKSETREIPKTALGPIRMFLKAELSRLKKVKSAVENSDPFKDGERTLENSLEEDVDEQIGHIDSQAKAKFLSRQIVQFRKALSRMKIGKYGYCERCGTMIDTDRLAVRPETTLCIRCSKELDE